MNTAKTDRTGILILFTALVFGITSLVVGQESASEKGKKAERPAVEDIFQDIMQTLPSDVKADVDSVKGSGTAVNMNTNNQATDNKQKIQDQVQNDKRLQELPEKVRNQVEKAIVEIDKTREERALEFKEMKKKNEQ